MGGVSSSISLQVKCLPKIAYTRHIRAQAADASNASNLFHLRRASLYTLLLFRERRLYLAKVADSCSTCRKFHVGASIDKKSSKIEDYHDLNYSDWNPLGITASASPAEQLGTAAIKLCIRSYGTDRNSMSGSNPCCFRAVQSPVVMLVHPVITGYVIELWHNAPMTCCCGDMPSQ
jgi:hypothetical protein